MFNSFFLLEGYSNIASVKTASHIDLNPRAPNLYSMALLTIKSNTFLSNVSLIPSSSNILLYCLFAVFLNMLLLWTLIIYVLPLVAGWGRTAGHGRTSTKGDQKTISYSMSWEHALSAMNVVGSALAAPGCDQACYRQQSASLSPLVLRRLCLLQRNATVQ